jgi:Helix-turn-helix domain
MNLLCEERPSGSPFVELIWRSQTEADSPFISMAETHSSIVVTRYHGKTMITVRGPESKPSTAFTLAGAETLGIMFKLGVSMADWPAQQVMDRRDVLLPEAAGNRFWLKGEAWQAPTYENADTFVQLRGFVPKTLSLRTAQRRFLRATGLTKGAMWQIDRARQAAKLLLQGQSILDTMIEAGYYDQPHLTRALKMYIGQTPAQIANPDRQIALSFLYNTPPLYLGDNIPIAIATEPAMSTIYQPLFSAS